MLITLSLEISDPHGHVRKKHIPHKNKLLCQLLAFNVLQIIVCAITLSTPQA